MKLECSFRFLRLMKEILTDIPDLLYRFEMWSSRMFSSPFKRLFYKHIGQASSVIRPLRVVGAKYICLGNKVVIDKGAFLYALKIGIEPVLTIKDGARIGHNCHIVSTGYVEVGEDVLIADRVYIGDNQHVYASIKEPIINQGVKFTGKTVIGSGTWIGDGVAIISSCIGQNCVVAANSVVTKDFPDFCVIGGVPAKIIKRYREIDRKWVNIYDNPKE